MTAYIYSAYKYFTQPQVLTDLCNISAQVKETEKKTTFADLNIEKKNVIDLRQKAIELHQSFSESNLDQKNEQLTAKVEEVFSEIVLNTYKIEENLFALLKEKLSLLMSILRQPENIMSEGLFRVSGEYSVLMKSGTMKLDETEVKKFKVNTVAGLLKKLLREMPDPLLQPIKAKLLKVNLKTGIKDVKAFVDALPAENKELLKMLIGFLSEVAANSATNQMSSLNLAVCIAPNLFKNDQADLKENYLLTTVFAVMIDRKDEIFNS